MVTGWSCTGRKDWQFCHNEKRLHEISTTITKCHINCDCAEQHCDFCQPKNWGKPICTTPTSTQCTSKVRATYYVLSLFLEMSISKSYFQQGDSGAPLICPVGQSEYLFGILSGGSNVFSKTITIYLLIFYHQVYQIHMYLLLKFLYKKCTFGNYKEMEG